MEVDGGGEWTDETTGNQRATRGGTTSRRGQRCRTSQPTRSTGLSTPLAHPRGAGCLSRWHCDQLSPMEPDALRRPGSPPASATRAQQRRVHCHVSTSVGTWCGVRCAGAAGVAVQLPLGVIFSVPASRSVSGAALQTNTVRVSVARHSEAVAAPLDSSRPSRRATLRCLASPSESSTRHRIESQRTGAWFSPTSASTGVRLQLAGGRRSCSSSWCGGEESRSEDQRRHHHKWRSHAPSQDEPEGQRYRWTPTTTTTH